MYRYIHQLAWLHYDSIPSTDCVYHYFHMQHNHMEEYKGEKLIMKKIIIFLVIIAGLFAVIAYMTSIQNTEKSADNPFEKDRLHAETIAQLDDENYQNIILPEELETALDNKEDAIVYFYSPLCSYCKQATPHLMEASKNMDIYVGQINLIEFPEGTKDFDIESTPTLIVFENGKEKERLVGAADTATFEKFFETYVTE